MPQNALAEKLTIEVEREPDVDAADMAELLVRIDLKHERRNQAERND